MCGGATIDTINVTTQAVAMSRGKRAVKKGKDVPKFGGVEQLGKVKLHNDTHEAASIEVQSDTKIEQDTGSGEAVALRCFIFGLNVELYTKIKPTPQQLFNSHLRGIEASLWKDGWKIYPEVEPRVVVEPHKMRYLIYVAARPMRGHYLPGMEKTLTLSDVING